MSKSSPSFTERGAMSYSDCDERFDCAEMRKQLSAMEHEIECICAFLDSRSVPSEIRGAPLTLVGRIRAFANDLDALPTSAQSGDVNDVE